MKIYITCTPEFSNDKLDEVVALLSGIPGELKFEKGHPLTMAQFKRLNNKFEDISAIKALTFEEYFDVVQGYREWREISDEDFIILISTIRNDKNWFSAFNKRNCFVHGDEWDIISNVDSKFGIAHQCVENIFQSLMGLDIKNHKNEPNIHLKTIGCINDFCEYKPDIIRKLKTADICDSCYERAKQKGISIFDITHINNIMEEIRKQFVISRNFGRETNLDEVKVNDKGKIFIGKREIKLDILPRVVYISFLNHLDGINSGKLCDKKKLFDNVYKKIKPNRDPDIIDKMCCKKTKITDVNYRQTPTFLIYKTRIKNELIKNLGVLIANYYSVQLVQDENHQNLYKVNLPKEKLDIHEKFKK